jgi:hypothetical protein
MCPIELPTADSDVDQVPRLSPDDGTGSTPRLIKTEVNFLRFPLFALHTKGLRTLDGIECQGRLSRAGQTHEYSLRISRNTASLYPGPLARKLHFALLSLAAERGWPLVNPITWSWRDLCRRMDIAYGGRTTVRQLKEAIRSTHGIVIHTQEALFSRAEQRPLPATERGHHLYSDFVFVNEERPDGTTADLNAVWFAEWYLNNLNSRYVAPLDYRLWQALDHKSSIASRLYEFLFFNFGSQTPLVRINYPNLAQLLPVNPERYASDARRQLDGPLRLLVETGVIGQVEWRTGKNEVLQLALQRGPRLAVPALDEAPVGRSEFDGPLEVREIRTTKPPEWFLAAEFYRLWNGSQFIRPGAKDLTLAAGLIDKLGQTQARAMLPPLIRRLREKWPDAKTFAAAAHYWDEIIAEQQRELRRSEHQAAEQLAAEREKEEHQRRQAVRQHLEQAWGPVWDKLSEADRDKVRAAVIVCWPHLRRAPVLFERKCLEELARRQRKTQSGPPADVK